MVKTTSNKPKGVPLKVVVCLWISAITAIILTVTLQNSLYLFFLLPLPVAISYEICNPQHQNKL